MCDVHTVKTSHTGMAGTCVRDKAGLSCASSASHMLTFAPCLCACLCLRLMLVALARRHEDDRDHYSNKRLDLGGPLLAGLFFTLFRWVAVCTSKYCVFAHLITGLADGELAQLQQ